MRHLATWDDVVRTDFESLDPDDDVNGSLTLNRRADCGRRRFFEDGRSLGRDEEFRIVITTRPMNGSEDVVAHIFTPEGLRDPAVLERFKNGVVNDDSAPPSPPPLPPPPAWRRRQIAWDDWTTDHLRRAPTPSSDSDMDNQVAKMRAVFLGGLFSRWDGLFVPNATLRRSSF